MAFAPFGVLADVEHLQGAVAVVELAHVDSLDASHVAVLGAPARHAAVQVAAQVAHPDCHREPCRQAAVLVVAADEHDLLLRVRDPGELGAEA